MYIQSGLPSANIHAGMVPVWCRYYYEGPHLIGPMVYMKTYIFNHFYEQYLVLLTMVPRNSATTETSTTTPHATTPANPICAMRFHRHYNGQPAVLHATPGILEGSRGYICQVRVSHSFHSASKKKEACRLNVGAQGVLLFRDGVACF